MLIPSYNTFLQHHGIATKCICFYMRGCREGQRVRTPPINHKKILGFIAILVRTPLKKITKLKSWRSMFGHRLPVGETPLYWCFAGVIWRSAGGWPAFSAISIFSALIRRKEKRCQRFTPSGKTYSIRT